MEISIDIPVNSYVSKIFQKHFGNPYKLSTKNSMGRVLLGILSLKKSGYKKFTGSEKITVIIPSYYFNQYRIKNISEENIGHLCNYLDDSFRQRLFTFLDSRLHLKKRIVREPNERTIMKITDSIDEFCELYKISEREISFDALRKHYYRERMLSKNSEN